VARFDAVAERYDAFCATPLGQFVEHVERELLKELLALRPGLLVADLGCGTGSDAIWMAEMGCDVRGVDESDGMLARAFTKVSREGRGHVECLKGDLAALAWPNNMFDVALLQVTLEFVADPSRVWSEAWRIIKPGGRLVIGLINGTGPWAQAYRLKAAVDPTSVYRNAHFWTLEELAALTNRQPDLMRPGLFVGPGEFVDAQAAWSQEVAARRREEWPQAGYLAVLYNKSL
jgi:ubiquinone/menaquinone biosynthesis C-methylase UbiE